MSEFKENRNQHNVSVAMTSNKNETCEGLQKEDGIYYGLFVPEEEKGTEDFLTVYTEKEEVLCLIKKFKNSRFKAFSSYDDAALFASGNPPFSPPLTYQQPSLNKNKELGTLDVSGKFKCPKPQELTKLRRAIEKGDKQFFSETVWANPLHLISSGDTPAILQEGCRYNALHVAAKTQKTEMVVKILETIEDPQFLKLLFGDEDEAICKQRMNYLIDSYLNMPDKGCFETPLHFAAKFGSATIVKILASHPLCERERKNKFGETPKEVICSRCSNPTTALKEEIESYLQPQYYVPILYREDNSTQAVLMKPLLYDGNPPSLSSGTATSPIMPSMKIRAYAGPMIYAKAEEFYKKFKKIHCSDDENFRTTGLSDYEKGLERLGRQLAKEINVPWTEYWSCLHSYCDIASIEGLKLLEEFFAMKLNLLEKEGKDANLSGTSSGLSSLCEAVEQYSFTSNALESSCSVSSEEDEYLTPPSSPQSSIYGSTCSLEQVNDCDYPLFVEGFYPTKSDMDIIRAIQDVEINQNDFPLVCQWRSNILSYPNDVSHLWPSPYSARYLPSPVLSHSPVNALSMTPPKRQLNELSISQRHLSSARRSLFSFSQSNGLSDTP